MSYRPDIKTGTTTAFGETITVDLSPHIQIENKYQIPPNLLDYIETLAVNGGVSDNIGNLFRVQSGVTAFGFSHIRSTDTLDYAAGEGIEAKFTAAFTTGIAQSLQFSGLFNATDTLAFGFDGIDFSCIHSHNGVVELQDILVTGVAGAPESCTVTLDGDAVIIPLTASTIRTNTIEIAAGLIADPIVGSLWSVEQVGDTVRCINNRTGNLVGTMSFSSATATATITEARQGILPTDNNTDKNNWSVTSSPFNGYDPTQLNVYKIAFGYLGSANIDYSIFDSATGEFVLVHRIEWSNTNIITNLGSPDFKIGWSSSSLGSSGTNLIVTGGSANLSVQGRRQGQIVPFSDDNQVLIVGATLTPIITIKAGIIHGKSFNSRHLNPQRFSLLNDHNKAAIIGIYKNAVLTGENYEYVDEFNSGARIDNSSSAITGGDLIASFGVAAADVNSIDIGNLGIEILPGETITLAARTDSGVSVSMIGIILWTEQG